MISPLVAVERDLVMIQGLCLRDHPQFSIQEIYEHAEALLKIVRGVPVPTAAQKAAYDFIKDWFETFNEMPTYREIAEGLDCGTTNAYRLVKGLEGRGLIRLGRSYTARSLRLVE